MCSAFKWITNEFLSFCITLGRCVVASLEILEPWTGTDTRRPINIYGLNFRDTDECIFQCTRRLEQSSESQWWSLVVRLVVIGHVISCHIMSYHVISCHIMSYHVISCHISKSKQHSQQMSILKAYSEPSSCHYPSSCPILCSLVPGQLQWCSLNVCLSTALSSAFCDPRKTSAKTIGHRFLIRKSASFCINLDIALNP